MENKLTQRLLQSLERANQISGLTDLDELLQQTLHFLMETAGASAGTFYLVEHAESTPSAAILTLKSIFPATEASAAALNQQVCLESGPLFNAAVNAQPQRAEFPTPMNGAVAAFLPLQELDGCTFQHSLCVPITYGEKVIGVLVAFDDDPASEELLTLCAARMASEIDKTAQLDFQKSFISRLKALIDFIGMIGSNLDRDQILRLIIDNARELLRTEASSLFMLDDETGESVLKIASNSEDIPIEEVRVPPGKGIIGATILSGEPVRTSDPARDRRHYSAVDRSSGFVTHSVLAVPLRARPVNLGQNLGTTEERIIGALEAINKNGSNFDAFDTELMETLASQAATVLKVAELYTNANELYLDIIKALAAAIDAKDPYTVGHSQRVSNFAVEIAHTLGLKPDIIQQIRIGALLHDVGKIGVPDAILLKPGRLTTEEYTWMKKHPAVGENIMNQVRMLHTALPCLSEHHEKIDGSGYPRGLSGSQISLMGRIVAVADVFDAVTSDRPYRPGMSIEDAFRIEREGIGSHFDGSCVMALMEAYRSGNIQVFHNQEGNDPTS